MVSNQANLRLTFSYHPFYSYSILNIQIFNVSLLKAQFYFEIIVAIVAVVSVALFLSTFFGISSATIMMPILAFHHIGTGWEFIIMLLLWLLYYQF